MVNAANRYGSASRGRAATPGELPAEGRLRPHVNIAHAIVDDPNPALRGRKQRVAVNRMTDGLEHEYSRGRISDAGYWAARTYGLVLERSRGTIGGASWSTGDKVDQVVNHEHKILSGIAKAQDAVAMIRDTAPAIGMTGQRILELVLVEGMTLTAAADRLDGRGDRQAVIFWSQTFRRSCELLAEHWCGRRNKAPR